MIGLTRFCSQFSFMLTLCILDVSRATLVEHTIIVTEDQACLWRGANFPEFFVQNYSPADVNGTKGSKNPR